MGEETTQVETEEASTNSVLTDTSTPDTNQDGTEQNSDTGADEASGDDTGADEASGDTGTEEGSTPPDTYADFVMPDGMELDTTALDNAVPIFKELGLNQDQAQKLVDFQAAQVKAGSQKQLETFNQLMDDWRDQSSNDKEFGGDKFDENIKTAQSAISKYGTPELKQLLDEHGVGNHPEVIRFMVRVGQTLNEDKPGSAGNTVSQSKDRAELLYPTKTGS